MYTKSSKCGVTSTLCYGVQWDAVMNYIDSNYSEGKCSADSFVADSTGTGGLESTGQYEQNHIYDLAGNVAEWTMEAYGEDRVARGGYAGNKQSASFREARKVGTNNHNLGFRVALYL